MLPWVAGGFHRCVSVEHRELSVERGNQSNCTTKHPTQRNTETKNDAATSMRYFGVVDGNGS